MHIVCILCAYRVHIVCILCAYCVHTVRHFLPVLEISAPVESLTTVKLLYSGHHRDFEKVSVIRRCPLYRGIFQEKLSLGTLKSVRYKELSAIKNVRCREVSLYESYNKRHVA